MDDLSGMLEGQVESNSSGPSGPGPMQRKGLVVVMADGGPEQKWSPSGRAMEEGCAHMPDPEDQKVGTLTWCPACKKYFRVTYFDAGMGGYPNYWKRAGKLFRFYYWVLGRSSWKDVWE